MGFNVLQDDKMTKMFKKFIYSFEFILYTPLYAICLLNGRTEEMLRNDLIIVSLSNYASLKNLGNKAKVQIVSGENLLKITNVSFPILN